MKTRVTYIISNVNKALAFEWISTHLDKERFQLDFILLNPGDSDLEQFLWKNEIPFERLPFHGKKDLLKTIFRIRKLLRKNRSQVVHTHLFEANLAGLTAAWLCGLRKRIHTRHHSTYHHVYYPKAVKYDRFINWLSTDIIAISDVVRKVLTEKERTDPAKVHIVHHGFLLDDFGRTAPGKNPLRETYRTEEAAPVIGVIARHTEWKGIQFIIPAFRQLLKTHPKALLIMANAHGEYHQELKKILGDTPSDNFRFIPFENDVAGLYQLFDIFVHTPIDPDVEAFGQTYVEALASGIPSIFTLSGIAHEFIRNEENALVVPHKNAAAVHRALERLIKDENLRKQLIINGKNAVNNSFGLSKMILSLELIYDR